MAFLILFLPLVALSLYLYWLTLPGYVPTGNEVYDAFAPVIHEQQLLNLAYEKTQFVCQSVNNKKLNKVITFLITCIGKCIPIDTDVQRKISSLKGNFKNSVDFVNFSSFFEEGFKKKKYIGSFIEKEQYDLSTYVQLVHTHNDDDSLFAIYNDAIRLYPDYSYWNFLKAEGALSKARFLIGSTSYKPETPTQNEIESAVMLAIGSVRSCNRAPINKMPDWYPRDIALQEGKKTNCRLPNKRVAQWIILRTSSYSMDIHTHQYPCIMTAYEKGLIGTDDIDEYLTYIHRAFSFEQRDYVPGGKILDIKHYIRFLTDIELYVVALTDTQKQDFDNFIHNVDTIEVKSKQMLHTAYKVKRVDEKSIEERTEKCNEVCDFITTEFSKLTPPTIEEWLAGGATLKPR